MIKTVRVFKRKKIAIISCSAGHAQAQNLKDSGLDVIVGLREVARLGSGGKGRADGHNST